MTTIYLFWGVCNFLSSACKMLLLQVTLSLLKKKSTWPLGVVTAKNTVEYLKFNSLETDPNTLSGSVFFTLKTYPDSVSGSI